MSTHTVSRIAIALLTFLLVVPAPRAAAAEQHKLSKKELKSLIARPKTPEDHQRLADYYSHKATKLESEAIRHHELQEYYVQHPISSEGKLPYLAQMKNHCRELSASLSKAAEAAKALAD